MDENGESSVARRASSRARKIAPKVGAALMDTNMRAQVTKEQKEVYGLTMLFPRAKLKRTRALAEIEALQSQANAQFSELVLNLAALARLDALEKDNAVYEAIELDDEEEASMDDEEQRPTQKKTPKGSKRKTRQARALERVASTKKAPRSFLDLLQEANLESLPPNAPSYLRAAVGPPSVGSRRHFCSVCGYTAPYTCPRCGARFCCVRCQTLHNDTRCQKFLA